MSCRTGILACVSDRLTALLPDTALIEAPTISDVDTTGATSLSYTNSGVSVACLLTEARPSVYALFAEAIQVGTLFRCRMPLGTEIDQDARITINDLVYRVARPSIATSNSISEDMYLVLQDPA